MIRLGICIDGIVRNKFEQFDRVYRKKFIKNPGLVQMNDNFDYVESSETEDETKRLSILENELIHLPMTTYDLKNHYEFETDEEYKKFLNEDYALEIYGSAPDFHRAMDVVNRLQYMGEKENLFTTTLICPGEEQVVTSTYYFLTKNACRIKHIDFSEYNSELWNNYDIIISDCPDILDTSREHKIAIRISKEYNTRSKNEYSFEDISKLYNLELMQKICSEISLQEIK